MERLGEGVALNMILIRKYILLTVVFSIASCSSEIEIDLPDHISNLENLTVFSAAERVEDTGFIRLVRDDAFGETDDIFIRSISHTAVDESGRVFITDPGERITHVYNQDGSYLVAIGSEGSGPGEYQSKISLKIRNNRLYLLDSVLQKLDIYSLESFSLIHTVPLNPENRSSVEELDGHITSDFFVRDDGTFLIRFSEIPSIHNEDSKTVRYYVLDRDGQFVEPMQEVFIQNDMEHTNYETDQFTMFYQPPFNRKSLFAVRNDGYLFSTWSEDFLIKRHTPDGEYVDAFYHVFHKSELDRNEFINSFEGVFRSAAQSVELPETWPALDDMIIDDENRFWISAIVDDDEVYQWWVLEESGKVVDLFEWPRNQPIQTVKNGFLYTRETDEETGLQQVVRYRIELEMDIINPRVPAPI